jgi:hypothetical protein
MTDYGSEGYHKNNDLGGRLYTDKEQLLIHFISAGLRQRDPFLTGGLNKAGRLSRTCMMPPDDVRPRDYIPAYTKIAGFVYELAKNLTVFPFPPQIPKKSVAEWVGIVANLKIPEAEEKPEPLEQTALKHVEVRLLLDNKVVASTADPAPPWEAAADEKTASSIEVMDPEKAKAILIRICDAFPGLLTDNEVASSDLAMELGLLIRSSV